MKRPIIVVLLVLLLSFGTALADEVSVYLDDEAVEFDDQGAFVDEEGRTQVPVRFVSDELGGETDWIEAEERVNIQRNDTELDLTIGVDVFEKDGEMRTMDTAPVITGEDRTVVPLRFVSEGLGAEVDWDGDTRTVYIYDDKEDPEEPGFEEGDTPDYSWMPKEEVPEDLEYDGDPSSPGEPRKHRGMQVYDEISHIPKEEPDEIRGEDGRISRQANDYYARLILDEYVKFTEYGIEGKMPEPPSDDFKWRFSSMVKYYSELDVTGTDLDKIFNHNDVEIGEYFEYEIDWDKVKHGRFAFELFEKETSGFPEVYSLMYPTAEVRIESFR
ncbi:copper amine oxidase N-terminal domain-containing protein [Natranaerofaba carboxydovora]|uniref:copper amine oxidase N-terminal domain-containing protein n=1 Tax=Natranaerofaba carboxydovora TaxID=2742683 RepID=UPI001F13C7E5|nr:copper amine oxidase N-terminal domain-containing protein [Natranaerofaba carboxydovora]UMZ73562.1 hypothetical protein ACONDI_01117 [Natranaerofaba carboxydovora]